MREKQQKKNTNKPKQTLSKNFKFQKLIFEISVFHLRKTSKAKKEK